MGSSQFRKINFRRNPSEMKEIRKTQIKGRGWKGKTASEKLTS
jgi:hypothetical protein